MPQAPTVAVPTRVPLGWDIETRDSTLDKDALLVNCYLERDKNTGTISVYRRPGTSLWLYEPAWVFSPDDRGRGIFQGAGGFVYITFGPATYVHTAPTTVKITWGGDHSPVDYAFVLGGNPGTIVKSEGSAYLIDVTNTVTGPFHTIDSDFPVFTNPGIAYLDGTTYVLQDAFSATAWGAVIWGSALNSVDDPTSWDPLNFITAQMTSDNGIYLTKQLGYVVVLKEWSTEFFYDAGNATGSPLAPAENLFFPIGCASPTSVQKIGETLIWLGTTKDVERKVVLMENTRPVVVSTAAVERIINSSVQDTGLSTAPYSWHLVTGGHTFYGLTFKDLNITLVFDLTEKVWYQWTDPDGNYLPFVSVTGGSGVPFLAQAEMGPIYVWDYQYNADYILEAKYGFSPNKGQSIPITLRTPRWDGGTARNKTLNFLAFVGDIIPGQILTVQTSDDDYQTWSTPKTVDLGMNYPNLVNCGSFRRRSWKLTLNDYLPFRLQYMELQVDIGTM